MELSRRLQAVAGLVTSGHRIADIGTDHAYIPIYLNEQEHIPSAIAMDINKGPLERARRHVEEAGLSGRIELRLSNGLEKLHPGEVETVVIAGMGGGLVCRILKENWDVTQSLQECILQPQSEIEKVRAFLLEEGFLFIKEEMVYEDRKYYPMMKVHAPADKMISKEVWSETEVRYGKMLLKQKNPVLSQFLEREYILKQDIITQLRLQGGEKVKTRIRELQKEIQILENGRSYYAV